MGRKIHRVRWELARRRVLIRDGYRCQSCGLPGRLEVDHVQPLKRGGSMYSLDNLQALCRACHIRKTAGENLRQTRLPWLRFRDELRGQSI